MATRLQLGTSRLEDLEVRVLEHFLDSSWIHLGDSEPDNTPRDLAHYWRMFRRGPLDFVKLAAGEVVGRSARPQRTELSRDELYRRTTFQPFFFEKGSRLSFDDEAFDYIFSEHFLHHLFLPDVIALLQECHRILQPHGVIRTVVPDADLRTYAPPERVGYPDVRMPFEALLKHKTRFSVYMLEEALRLTGFEPVSLVYCDKHGEYIRRDPAQMQECYSRCPEKKLVFELDHVTRIDSLIVDGIKRSDAN